MSDEEEPEDDVKVERKVGRFGRRLTVDTHSRVISDLVDDPKRAGPVEMKRHPAQDLQTPGAVVSIWGSAPNDKDVYVPYFAQKGMNVDGKLSRMKHQMGVLSHRGHKLDQPNQDEFFVLARADSVLLGVLDGHGVDGHDVAHFAQEHLPSNVIEGLRQDLESWKTSVPSAVKKLCQQAAEGEISKKAENSGCTVSLVMLDRAKSSSKLRLRCAHLGDSIAVLAKRDQGSESWKAIELTEAHRADREDERQRIEAAGGTVIPAEGDECARLDAAIGSIAVSRSFGDHHARRYGLSAEPEIAEDIELDDSADYFILVCSDGIWDVMPPSQAVNLVGKFLPSEAQKAVEKLVSKAQLKWQQSGDIVDDITALLLWPAFGEGLEAVSEDKAVDEKAAE